MDNRTWLPGCNRSMHSSVFLMCDISTELIYCLFVKLESWVFQIIFANVTCVILCVSHKYVESSVRHRINQEAGDNGKTCPNQGGYEFRYETNRRWDKCVCSCVN